MLSDTPINGGRRQWIAGIATSLISLWLTWPMLSRQWIPHDEGMLGQTAERIRLGQLPHRDFEELYTGGLSYWHSMMQSWFGTHLMAARYGILMVWVCWLLLVYWLVRRTNVRMHEGWAIFVTCVIGAWSLPIYPAAMPSWYLLFLATAAVAALMQWSQAMHRRWLIIAGASIGLALLVKITALYLVAASIVSVLVIVQQSHERRSHPTVHRRPTFEMLTTATILVLVVLVVLLLRHDLSPAEVMHLVMPITAIGVSLIYRERMLAMQGVIGVKEVMRALGWFVGGMTLVVAPFVMWYVANGAIDALVRGVIVDAMNRVSDSRRPMLELSRTVRGLWFVAMYVILWRVGHSTIVWVGGLGSAVLIGWLSTQSLAYYRIVWEGARWLLPFIAALSAVRYVQQPVAAPTDKSAGRMRGEALILATFASLFALNQYPFSAPVYYVYVAPLVLLTLTALEPQGIRKIGGVFAVLGIFARYNAQHGSIATLGQLPMEITLDRRMSSERSGLLVGASDSVVYHLIDSVIKQHRGGGTIIAGPDAPEITFLSGPPYYGRLLFSPWPDSLADSSMLSEYFGQELPTVVVWNLKPPHSPDISPQMRGWFEHRYPKGMQIWSDSSAMTYRGIGRGYEIRWRER